MATGLIGDEVAYTDEQALDVVGTALVAGNNIDITVNDGADTITIAVETLTAADISDVTASAAELNFTDGVTSALQTQLDGKQPLDADLTTLAANITAAGHALVDDANAAAQIATLGLDADISTFAVPANTTISAYGKTLVDDADAATALGTLGLTATAAELNALDGITSTVTELNYTDGVTSAIQTQLNTKAADADVVHDTGAETIAGVKTFSSDPLIPDEAYDATAWNGVLEPPTKNAVRDKIESMAGGVSDGDKVDITVSASGATWTIDNDVVTYAKMQNISATDKLLGRSTAGAGDTEEIACTSFGRALIDDASVAAQRVTLGLSTFQITVILGDGTNAIVNGAASKGWFKVAFACTVTAWELVADASGSIVIDIWKDTYANFPPTDADRIAGTDKPTLSSVQKNTSTALTGWTTSIAAGDYLGFEVESAATVKQVTLTLTVTR
jgi:hypothetical protein